MRAQHARDDRANGVANPKQEQDPIERRRLQNRLSQRNHRRKIRDRIAKLQERVIASELRAAASLNGWNYHHPTASLATPTTPAYDVERKGLSPAVEIMPAMSGSYLPGSTGTYYPFSTLSPAAPLPPQPSPPFPQYEATAKEVDSSGSSPPSALTNSSVCSPGAGSFNLDMAPNAASNYVPSDMNGQFQTEPWNIYTPNSQSNFYYMTTEASLPQILQILDTGNLRPKAVILLQPDAHQAGVPPLSTSQPPSPVEQAAPAPSAFPMQGLTCQCHNRSFLTESPVDWMHATASTSICPLHGSSPLDGYQQKLP
ncbi:hypothetical protein ANOM_003575 [Aspergillus nomiae NRRL 13137]|uniref:BZIP domain-containing protein n=1 Tax=Aspergillus nomiae NRRL (strain ATCC 15546 / NRRL 13137 / CBS 260.88 / M93) TaxID=1509407 RepID=A0A0L1J9C6_ASPN3|nr:uncharacterized protein ANOM_003575 [Aspergillus nomiae NRRL 13137]KNG88349.1 hypothetical protein ANOM_003575 [Aspergillus nomiae NRRL 13137]